MRKIIKLTKILFKNSFGTSEKGKNKNSKKSLLYAFLFIYLIGVFGVLSYSTIAPLKEIGQESIFLALMFIAIVCLILFTSIFSILNIFYFSKDIKYLLPLPFKMKEIVLAKFNQLLLYEYYTEFIFALPAMVLYGIMMELGALYYVYSLIILLALPILPLIISTLIIMLVMMFSNLTKYKEKFQLIATVITIIFVIAIQLVIKNYSMPNGDLNVELIIQESNGLVNLVSNYFVTTAPSINALLHYNELSGFLNILKLLVISVVPFVAFAWIAEKMYARGIRGNDENAGKKKIISSESDVKKQSVKTSIAKAYILKEWRLLSRNPIFLMQCVLPSLLIPLLYIAIFVINGSQNSVISEMQMNLPSQAEMVFILLVIFQIFSMMNYSSVTAVSREGRMNASYNKIFPIPLYNQLVYKIALGVILTMISCLITSIVAIAIKVPVSVVMIALAIELPIAIVQNYFYILIDFKKPKLDWDTEYAVVKQNINMLGEIIIAISTMILLGILTMVMYKFDIEIVAIILMIIGCVALKITDIFFRKNINKIYKNVN